MTTSELRQRVFKIFCFLENERRKWADSEVAWPREIQKKLRVFDEHLTTLDVVLRKIDEALKRKARRVEPDPDPNETLLEYSIRMDHERDRARKGG